MASVSTVGFDQTQLPAWAGDYFSREHVVPGGAKLDASQFLAADGTKAVVAAAGAAGDATSIPLKTALVNAIPNGTSLDFGGKKFARLTAAAAKGATTLTVAALPTALVEDDTATYAGTGTKKKLVPSGTVIGRTLAERDAKTGYGPADPADDEIYILVFDVTDAENNPDADLYRWGSLVKETFLPDWSNLDAGVQDAIRANYHCTIGAD